MLNASPNPRAPRAWPLMLVSESLDTGTATGRMVLTVLAALAEMEREQVGERTTRGGLVASRGGLAAAKVSKGSECLFEPALCPKPTWRSSITATQ